jgi:hypothetical protein
MLIKINQHLSKSIICSWKINKNPEPPKGEYNIVSVVFFRKYESYKDISMYVDGLTRIIKNFNKILPTFRLRIYHDYSSLEIIKNILKESNILEELIELYEYDIPFFKEEKDKTYHMGTIGSFIRYLPLFDIDYHKVDRCLIHDIDNHFQTVTKDILKFCDDNKITFSYRSRFCYNGVRIMCVSDENIVKFPLISSFVYQTVSIPYNILGDFIENLYINNDIILMKLIKDCKIINMYEYGIDEIFMNEFYVKYFYQNKIKIATILFNHVSILNGMLNYFDYIETNKDIEKYWEFICGFFKIININIDKKLNDKLIMKETLKGEKLNLKTKINNIFKNKNQIDKLKQYIKEIYNKYDLYKFKLLLTCILNHLLYININMINILLLSTDYKFNAITTNIEKKMIKY